MARVSAGGVQPSTDTPARPRRHARLHALTTSPARAPRTRPRRARARTPRPASRAPVSGRRGRRVRSAGAVVRRPRRPRPWRAASRRGVSRFSRTRTPWQPRMPIGRLSGRRLAETQLPAGPADRCSSSAAPRTSSAPHGPAASSSTSCRRHRRPDRGRPDRLLARAGGRRGLRGACSRSSAPREVLGVRPETRERGRRPRRCVAAARRRRPASS